MLYRLRKLRRKLRSGFDRFWFAKQDPTLVGLIRIATGLMLMYTHVVWGMRLHDFFGSHSWMRPDIVHNLQADQYHFSYLWWVSDEWLVPAHVLAFVVLTAFTCGFLTRVTSVLSVVVLVSYIRRQPAATFGLDQVTTFLTLYLAYGYLFTPSAARALSLDRLIWLRWEREDHQPRALPKSASANVTLRLIQIQMCIVYFFAGAAKVRGDAWWNGEAMWLAFASEEYANSLSMLWTAHFPIILSAASLMTILWEIFFVAFAWNARSRPIFLFFGFWMHIGIGLFLSMWTFGLMMIVGCCSFMPTDRVAMWVGYLTRRSNEGEDASSHASDDVAPESKEADSLDGGPTPSPAPSWPRRQGKPREKRIEPVPQTQVASIDQVLETQLEDVFTVSGEFEQPSTEDVAADLRRQNPK